MTAHKRCESITAGVQQSDGAQHGTDQALPLTLRDSGLMAIVGLAHSAFYKRKANGEFRFLELRPQLLNSNTLYSGHLVGQWLRGEIPSEQPRRFFGRATPPLGAKRPVGRPRKRDQSVTVLSHERSLREGSDGR